MDQRLSVSPVLMDDERQRFDPERYTLSDEQRGWIADAAVERRAGGLSDSANALLRSRGGNSRSRPAAGISPAQFSPNRFGRLLEYFTRKIFGDDDADTVAVVIGSLCLISLIAALMFGMD